MTKEEFFHIIGEADERKVAAAGMTVNKKNSRRVWVKWGAAAACLCLVIAGALCGIHSTMKQYVVSSNIVVFHDSANNDSCEVTQEQGNRMAAAHHIHNTLTAQNYAWYGSCYYDFENDQIMVGLTDVSDSNKDLVLTHTGDTAVRFYACDYSYRYLEELYNKLDNNRIILYLLGADRFHISIEKNRVWVHISNPEKYEAICMANKLDSMGGAIVFTSDAAAADK